MAEEASQNWTCPFCNRPQTVTPRQVFRRSQHLDLSEHKYDAAGVTIHAVACANPECQEIALTVAFTKGTAVYTNHGIRYTANEAVERYDLRPESSAKPQPEYIPKAIRDDYYEACRIRNLSPKSSAALARRCLQGMIRDFCEIREGRLIDEIEELHDRVEKRNAPRGVTGEAVEAIDHVRSIGNIGAHMEKDVNLIIEIEAGEAQALIDLVEMLLEEWYVAREQRTQRLSRVAAIGKQKSDERTTQKGQASSKAQQGKSKSDAG